MFHAPVSVGLLDRYRVPYSVVAPGAAPRASNGVYSIGRSDGTGPRVFVMRTSRDADGTAYRFEGATLYVQLPERAAVSAALETTACREFLYLIQDFEPAFYPASSNSALAMATYNFPMRAIFNCSVMRGL